MRRFILFCTLCTPVWFTGSVGFAQNASKAERALDVFRRGWQPKKGYMRPLDDKGWQARMRALQQLVRLGDAAMPTLVKALKDPKPHVRAFAAQAISFIAEPAKKPLNHVLANDKDPIARLYAADALGAAGSMKSNPLYNKVANNDSNRDVKAHVRFALERKGKKLDPSIQKNLRNFPLTRMATAKIGHKAPDFTLRNTKGKKYTLSDFRSKKPVVLIFIYGDT